MSDDEDLIISPEDTKNYMKIGLIAVVAVVVLTGITIGAYNYAKKRSSTVVLPGGTTYLGPSQEQAAAPPQANPGPSKFTIDPNTPWKTVSGNYYPFSFSYPETLVLVIFPNDKTDSVAVSFNNIPAQQNLIFRAVDINIIEPDLKEYINKPKIEYVKNWWKQYSGLKGAKSIDQFVNAKGMTGYKALYITQGGDTPNMDVFFEIPNKPNMMIWFSRSILDQTVFDRIIDSFYWDPNKPIKTLPN